MLLETEKAMVMQSSWYYGVGNSCYMFWRAQ